MSYEQRVATIDAKTEQITPNTDVKRFPIVGKLAIAFDFIFGCWHRKLSRPFTLSGWTYEVCLNCGKKFAYTRAEIGLQVPNPSNTTLRAESWAEDYRGLSLITRPQA